ncbi:hypothetical protein ACQKP0_24925 [Heyndrickxia sp. NPDC080065]|uniref:hypothetical protein n=1 Tax=Heyndrickxia sp. NPDC080065 TaxID=3390568 RepID=UPI003D01128F
MKKLLLSLTVGVFLFGGAFIYNNVHNTNGSKNIAAGGDKEPSILSARNTL